MEMARVEKNGIPSFYRENENRHHKKYPFTESDLKDSGRISASISVRISSPSKYSIIIGLELAAWILFKW